MRRKKGFTMVELLIVMGVGAILLAVIGPNFLSQRQKSIIDSEAKKMMAVLRKGVNKARSQEDGSSWSIYINNEENDYYYELQQDKTTSTDTTYLDERITLTGTSTSGWVDLLGGPNIGVSTGTTDVIDITLSFDDGLYTDRITMNKYGQLTRTSNYGGGGAGGSPSSLTINNSGFEEDILADGGVQPGSITGWTASTAGVYNPTTNQFTDEAFEGSNVAYSNGGTISQVLSDTLEGGKTYVLTVKVGDRKDLSFPGYTVELRANGVLLDSTTSPTPSDDDWTTATVSYDCPGGHAEIGEALEIRLDGDGVQVAFDDVQLTVQ